jgi:hypothetical protein
MEKEIPHTMPAMDNPAAPPPPSCGCGLQRGRAATTKIKALLLQE